MKPEPLPRVTDHAVLRFLERVQGINIEAARQLIAKRCATAIAVGTTSLRADGVRYEFSGTTVVTVVPDHGSQPCRTKINQMRGGRG
jgi:hypothetical protein